MPSIAAWRTPKGSLSASPESARWRPTTIPATVGPTIVAKRIRASAQPLSAKTLRHPSVSKSCPAREARRAPARSSVVELRRPTRTPARHRSAPGDESEACSGRGRTSPRAGPPGGPSARHATHVSHASPA